MTLTTPWWFKMAAKMVLSRLPIDYRRFAHLGMFKHGDMQGIDYALAVVRYHVEHANKDLQGAVCLELGPGDSISGGLIARALGASKVYLADSGAYADTDITLYQTHSQELRSAGLITPDISGAQNFDELLAIADLVYLTDGLDDLKRIPSACVDFAWSQAVLEHVREAQFSATMDELRRILKPEACASHRVDLQDHLSNSLHNLRFSTERWEQEWVAESGFYTNRIRYAQMLNLFDAAGFETKEIFDIDRWRSLPLATSKMHERYAHLPEQELLIKSFTALLTPR